MQLRWLVLCLAACGGSAPEATTPKLAAGPAATEPVVRPAMARKVMVTIGADGYAPSVIEANPNEQLTLVFERPDSGNCGGEVVFPSMSKRLPVDVGAKVEVPITAPASGEIGFTCGMDMYRGKVVVVGG